MAHPQALCHHAGLHAAFTGPVISAWNKQNMLNLPCRSSQYLTARGALRLSAHPRNSITGHSRNCCRSKYVWRASSEGDSQSGAAGEGSATAPVVFEGVYGPWTIEQSDRIEVLSYRAALVLSTASFLLASSSAFLPSSSPLLPLLLPTLDPLYFTSAASLGLALVLIHIYVTPLKRFLQALWLTGSACSLILVFTSVLPSAAEPAAATQALVGAAAAAPPPSLVLYCLTHPSSMWAIGPLFAALTGLVFKEGLCYGKLEAALLTLLIPTLCLGHLSGFMGDDTKRLLLAVWMVLASIFAARKFSQPIKDDIGDKSVFLFQAMSPEEQEELLRALQRRQADANSASL